MRTTVAFALVVVLCQAALAQPQRNDSVVVVPAPRAVAWP
jgi:parvulin-like peptidyl-prolyl isomerase